VDKFLKLNTLKRFSKTPHGLLREEHGHCEVPAGCGGMVLRWLNPDRELPMLFRFYTPGEGQVFLDGKALTSSCALVAYGRHAICLQFKRLLLRQGGFLFSARLDLKAPQKTREEILVLSSPDGRWMGRRTPPPDDGWLHPGYQDTDWEPLEEIEIPGGDDAWRQRGLRGEGARPLGLSESSVLWVRREFELSK
jgi:hypothetical protein